MEQSKDQKVLVGIGDPLVRGGTPTVLLGIPRQADEYLRDGQNMCHTLDLRKVGINATVIIFGGETSEDCVQLMLAGAEATGAEVVDKRQPGVDLGIDDPTVQ